MKFSVWEETGMGAVPHQPTDTGTPCYQCHRAGIGGNFMDADSFRTFEGIQELPFLTALVQRTYDEEGCVIELVRSTLLLDKADAPAITHPGFDWSSEREQAIIDFFDRTHESYLSDLAGSR